MPRRIELHRAVKGLEQLLTMLALPVHEVSGALVIGDLNAIMRSLSEFSGDVIAFEAFVNHVHLEDVLNGILKPLGEERVILMRLGASMLNILADKLQPFLTDRNVLAYVGGADTVALRFHTESCEGRNWVDLSDVDFLIREQLWVFRITKAGVTPLFPSDHARPATN